MKLHFQPELEGYLIVTFAPMASSYGSLDPVKVKPKNLKAFDLDQSFRCTL